MRTCGGEVSQGGTDYDTRAPVAWLGPGALWALDAVYPTAYHDSDGNLLGGSNKYALHLEKDQIFPSNSGVWSASPYSGNFYVRDAINRYALPGCPSSITPTGRWTFIPRLRRPDPQGSELVHPVDLSTSPSASTDP
jgi:hypothetical protein